MRHRLRNDYKVASASSDGSWNLSLRLLLDAVTNLVIIHNVTVGAVVTLSRVLPISDRERLFFVRGSNEGGGRGGKEGGGGGEEEWQGASVNVTYRREVGTSVFFVLGRDYINDFKSNDDARCFKDSPSYINIY